METVPQNAFQWICISRLSNGVSSDHSAVPKPVKVDSPPSGPSHEMRDTVVVDGGRIDSDAISNGFGTAEWSLDTPLESPGNANPLEGILRDCFHSFLMSSSSMSFCVESQSA